MAAPKRNRTGDPEVRARIQTTQLINRLHDNALKAECMTPGQIKSAEILLRKAIPDLAAVQHSGELALKRASDLPDDILANIATGSGTGASETQGSKTLLN